jgi:hypothetical protein
MINGNGIAVTLCTSNQKAPGTGDVSELLALRNATMFCPYL